MYDLLNMLIDQSGIPLLAALSLGIMTSLSPCPLATNITAIAFISKDVASPRKIMLSGLMYTLGRAISYLALSLLIVFGFSEFKISSLFQGWGDKALGPLLIVIGLVMLDVIEIPMAANNNSLQRFKQWLSQKGYAGSLLLGMLFALAFCPYSGVLFFGALIPLMLSSTESILLAPAFALGTSIPVMIFAILLSSSMNRISVHYARTQKLEKVFRKAAAAIFIVAGLYYLQFLIRAIT